MSRDCVLELPMPAGCLRLVVEATDQILMQHTPKEDEWYIRAAIRPAFIDVLNRLAEDVFRVGIGEMRDAILGPVIDAFEALEDARKHLPSVSDEYGKCSSAIESLEGVMMEAA